MNANNINDISFNGWFWIRFRPQLILFDWDELPEGVHFAISFNEKSSDFNFHVTKNVGDGINKPKITIFCMDKKLLQEWLEEISPKLSVSFLNKMLEPLDIIELKNKYGGNLGFVSLETIKNADLYSLTEEKLIDSFREISKIKKNRLKIKGDIKTRLDNWINSEDLSSLMFNSVIEPTLGFERSVDGGFIVTEEKAIPAFRIINRWFSIRETIEPSCFLNEFIPRALVRHLNWKTKRAIVAIQKAKTFDDTRHLNNPTRLIIKTATGEIKDKGTALKLT